MRATGKRLHFERQRKFEWTRDKGDLESFVEEIETVSFFKVAGSGWVFEWVVLSSLSQSIDLVLAGSFTATQGVSRWTKINAPLILHLFL